MYRRTVIAAGMVTVGIILGSFGCTSKNDTAEIINDSAAEVKEWEEAEHTPYGRYPETVTYTLGQMSGTNNSNLPEGDTYENNAYTRYLSKMLNIQNRNIYMESEERYDDFLNVIIKDGTLPDILVLSDRKMVKELVEEDLVEDLTEVYEQCTTPRIKEMFKSYGDQLLETVTFDGRLMAVPETVIDHGPRLLWMRKDWMEALGLKEPSSLEEAFDIIEEFRKNKMGAKDGEEAIGLVFDTSMVGTTSSNYSLDPVFDSFGARPQRWQQDENGNVVYGSLTQETKEALAYLHKLYVRGILDSDFALRAQNNLRDLVVEGRCGAFFGLWWSPNNPLMDGYERDSEADWEPYYFPAEEKEAEKTYTSFRDNKYVVVRKGYEHPEIAMKIISVLFDYTRYEAKDAQEVNDYFALNVDPTARPLVINVDYNEAAYQVTKDIRKVFSGEMEEGSLSGIEQSYYAACKRYLAGESAAVEDWAAYKSRISAVGLLIDADYIPPERSYLESVDMEIPQTLQTLERNAFIQIIMGRKPVNYFDTFVEEWLNQGGKALMDAMHKG